MDHAKLWIQRILVASSMTLFSVNAWSSEQITGQLNLYLQGSVTQETVIAALFGDVDHFSSNVEDLSRFVTGLNLNRDVQSLTPQQAVWALKVVDFEKNLNQRILDYNESISQERTVWSAGGAVLGGIGGLKIASSEPSTLPMLDGLLAGGTFAVVGGFVGYVSTRLLGPDTVDPTNLIPNKAQENVNAAQ